MIQHIETKKAFRDFGKLLYYLFLISCNRYKLTHHFFRKKEQRHHHIFCISPVISINSIKFGTLYSTKVKNKTIPSTEKQKIMT